LAPLLARGPERVAVLPGNHDHYVREHGDEESRTGTAFYKIFGAFCPGPDGFSARALGGPWWLAAWDSTLPTPLGSAQGEVRAETLAATERWQAGLPADARVILANHYPVVFPASFWPGVYHQLRNLADVRAWLQAQSRVNRQPGSNIEVLLHGHIHQPWIVSPAGDLNARPPVAENAVVESAPGMGVRLSINSASSSQRVRHAGDPAFHRLTLPLEPGAPVRVEALAVELPHTH
jgi:3',5'-cyclic AMP phosphodiesterase CpdA